MHIRPPLIIHADADAFFAQVETIKNPSLVGKPVIVGGTTNRGIVTSATYEARAMGVYTTMPIAQARRLCPNGVFLPGDHAEYARFSERMFEVFESFTPAIEGTSVDEAYLDFTGCERLHGIRGWAPMEEGTPGGVSLLAEKLRNQVKARTGLRVSIGVASSKLVAKVATDFGKPGGITVIFPGREAAFLSPMPVGTIPGIGAKSAAVLERAGIARLGALAATPEDRLVRLFGPGAGWLAHRARGEDESRVESGGLPKSTGRSTTFERDTDDVAWVERVLHSLTERAAKSLREDGLVARTVSVKVKYADFTVSSAAETLSEPSDLDDPFFEAGRRLLRKAWKRRARVRLVGVTLSGLALAGERQRALFGEEEHERRARLYERIDRIRAKHGDEMLRSGRTFGPEDRKPRKRRRP